MKFILIIILSFTKILSPQSKAVAEIFLFQNQEKSQIILKVNLEKGWHLYWRNSGDAGIPTEIKWELPEGISISNSLWPVPKAFESEGLVSYGYENEAIFLFDFITNDVNDISKETISCKINSLICKEVCIPFDTMIVFKLSDIKTIKNFSEIFHHNEINFPINNSSIKLNASLQSDKILLEVIKDNLIENFNKISFFPYENGVIKNAMYNNFVIKDNKYLIDLYLDQFKTHIPPKLEGLLILTFEENKILNKKAYEISVDLIQ
jgi:thiol:disulfide interchange protein DsbD